MHLLRPILLISASFLVFSSAFADEVPLEHQDHCREWKDGKCTSGALTDLAKTVLYSLDTNEEVDSGSDSAEGEAPEAETPDEEVVENACKDSCSSCDHCSKCQYCSLCSWYNSSDCKGLAYYDDEESCTEMKTETCCDLCEISCTREGNYCGKGGLCGDGTNSISVKCHEAQGQNCLACNLVN